MSSKKLIELEEITKSLPNFAKMVAEITVGETQTFNMDSGTGIQIAMFNDKDIAIARGFFSKGSLCPIHSHSEKEIIIVYEGCMEIRFDDGSSKILNQYDHISIQPQIGHCGYAVEDTWFVAITLPASKEWPHAK